jgi:hypothetical protein
VNDTGPVNDTEPVNDTGPASEDATVALAALVCATCGRHPDVGHEATALLTWSRDTSGAAVSWTCDRCSREHLRSIEGKLDPVWW